MERESFKDESVAAYLNENFVSIKVDREERPDVDEVYMTAVQIMIGSGGWPLTVFLTPELKPFYGGTYFPPQDYFDRPGFRHVLEQITNIWQNDRARLFNSASQINSALSRINREGKSSEPYNIKIATNVIEAIVRLHDPQNGGFGSAPKFPQTGYLDLLMRVYYRTGNDEYLEIVEKTLTKMGEGGIFDQLGGGFHRYSTDAGWLIPHFEKMLYDNALLAKVLLDCYLITGKQKYADIARMTLDWVLREMADSAGGFHSTLDADSDGKEGKFYVWSAEDIDRVLESENSLLFADIYGVSTSGNFEEGKSVLHLTCSLEAAAEKYQLDSEKLGTQLAEMKKKLLLEREKRIRPGLDDKVLIDWNGMMISAMASGYRVLGDIRYIKAARRSADFILSEMWDGKQLRHSYRPVSYTHLRAHET